MEQAWNFIARFVRIQKPKSSGECTDSWFLKSTFTVWHIVFYGAKKERFTFQILVTVSERMLERAMGFRSSEEDKYALTLGWIYAAVKINSRGEDTSRIPQQPFHSSNYHPIHNQTRHELEWRGNMSKKWAWNAKYFPRRFPRSYEQSSWDFAPLSLFPSRSSRWFWSFFIGTGRDYVSRDDNFW